MPISDQGILSDRYKIIPRTLVFLTREDEVLLIKGAPHKYLWANLYNGLGGHIERGEDVKYAAQREIYEEIGVLAPSLRLCGVVLIDAEQETGIGLYVFRGEYSKGDICPSSEGTPEWVSREKIYQLPCVEDLPILLSHVLELKSGEPPFCALYQYDQSGKLKIKFSGEEVWQN
jgi:8-oxo-dGTP diphosphatase